MAALQQQAPVLSAGATLPLLRTAGAHNVPTYETLGRPQTNGSFRGLGPGTAESRGTLEGPLLSEGINQLGGGMGSNGTFVVGMLVRCEECGKKFINSFYLEKHKNKRHRVNSRTSAGVATGPNALASQDNTILDAAFPTLDRRESQVYTFETPRQTADVATLRPMPTTQRSSLLSNSRDAPSRALGRQSNAVNITEFLRGPTEPMLQPDVEDTSRKLKAEVQKEVHDVVKVRHIVLADLAIS
ncbi:hypothetical protein TGP89_362290 [Toxoplasma gondii p89]|uniref:C2H2-type domain-containing protein n=1 Tax=Toxoplasma gondii p89 TaxID=943119 RepID=A0A086JHR9_TOXGO|nr:hypothetical protein TGP89_362290 [Toxoplasma gondii p89]